MSTNWSDPSLATTTLNETDLFILLRPNSDGTYSPKNITAAVFAQQIIQMGLEKLAPSLPVMEPEGGGLWLNAGAISWSTETAGGSGDPLTPAAATRTLTNLLNSLPTSDPGTGAGTYWNNDGIITPSVAV